MNSALNLSEVVTPGENKAEEAAQAARALAPLLGPSGERRAPQVVLRPEGGQEAISVPREAFDLFMIILENMALGNAVMVVPIHAELTTQQAANLLNVSRPYLIGLLDQGKIPFHKVGTHRRVRFEDLLAWQRQERQRQEQLLREMAAEDQELGLGY